MKNIELKVKVENFTEIEMLLKSSGAVSAGRMSQKDVYYRCETGRLKIREINRSQFNLLYYNRPDKVGPKVSDYYIVDLDRRNGLVLNKIFSEIYGERATIQKERRLWLYKHTRIHLDTVRGLGNFVELETVVRGISRAVARKEHNRVVALLKLEENHFLAESYMDLMMRKRGKR